MNGLEFAQVTLKLKILDTVIRDVTAENDPERIELLKKNVIPQAEQLNARWAELMKEWRKDNGMPEPPPVVIQAKAGEMKPKGANNG